MKYDKKNRRPNPIETTDAMHSVPAMVRCTAEVQHDVPGMFSASDHPGSGRRGSGDGAERGSKLGPPPSWVLPGVGHGSRSTRGLPFENTDRA